MTEATGFGDERPAGLADRSPVWGLLIAILLSATFLAVYWGRAINHDTAWYLIATRDWLSGATLYADIVEVNPPLGFYLTVPAVLLSDLFSIGLANAQYLSLALLYGVCLTWIWNLLQAAQSLGSEQKTAIHLGAAAAMVLPFLPDVAQREHFLVMLMMPWAIGKLVLGPTSQGEAMRTAVAAIGICIKPFFVLYPAAVTLVEVVRARSLRPVLSTSNLVFLAIGLAYLALVALRHPLYLTDIVPIASQVYGDYGTESWLILLPLRHPAVVLGMILVLLAARSVEGRMGGGYLLALSGAALAIYLVQWTGYGYQFRPFLTFLLLSAVWVAAHHPPRTPRGVVALLAIAMLLVPLFRQGFYSLPATERVVAEIEAQGGSERLNVLSTRLDPGPPAAMAAGVEWASRYPALWLVPGTVNRLAEMDCAAKRETCARLEAILARTVDDIVTDIVERRPDTLIFDNANHYIRIPDFSWPALLSRDPRFGEAMRAYGPARINGEYEIYRLLN